jgi:chemotaxis signal transduction protein
MNHLGAQELRAEFDRGFTLAAAPAPGTRDFVLIRVNAGSYALAADELQCIEPHAAVVPIPTSETALLGIAGLHGEIVPVFSLAQLLGTGRLTPRQDGRWMFALVHLPGAASDAPSKIGLAFDELLQFVRIEQHRLFADGAQGGARTLLHAETLYPMIDPCAVLERIIPSKAPSKAPSNAPTATAQNATQSLGIHGDAHP